MRAHQHLPKRVEQQRFLHVRAKQFRKQPTEAEEYLWRFLKGYNTFPVRFRRQYPIRRYIADFCCYQNRLIIEVDGPIHEQTKHHDKVRDKALKEFGFKILRFSNDEVLNHINDVLIVIKNNLSSPE